MPVVVFRPLFDRDRTDWEPALRKIFSDMDFRVVPNEKNRNDAEYLITWNLQKGDAAAWPNLKAVLSLSAGINQYTGHPEFPVQAKLIRMVDPGMEARMAEYMVWNVLGAYRGFEQFSQDARSDKYDGSWPYVVPPVPEKVNVGIMGLGQMGRACLSALAPFGFSLRGWARTEKKISGVACYAGQAQLDDFLRDADILICLLPLTPETENILNRDTMSRLPRGAYIINAGRGKQLVDEDLIALLDSGHLKGAVLDVFRKEPLPKDHPFWAHPKIRITPHISAMTMPDTGAESLRRAIGTIEKGGLPEGFVPPGSPY